MGSRFECPNYGSTAILETSQPALGKYPVSISCVEEDSFRMHRPVVATGYNQSLQNLISELAAPFTFKLQGRGRRKEGRRKLQKTLLEVSPVRSKLQLTWNCQSRQKKAGKLCQIL